MFFPDGKEGNHRHGQRQERIKSGVTVSPRFLSIIRTTESLTHSSPTRRTVNFHDSSPRSLWHELSFFLSIAMSEELPIE